MGRRKLEPTRPRSIRLPERLWKLVYKAAGREHYRSVNALIQTLLENHLVDEGMMEDSERRLPMNRRKHTT